MHNLSSVAPFLIWSFTHKTCHPGIHLKRLLVNGNQTKTDIWKSNQHSPTLPSRLWYHSFYGPSSFSLNFPLCFVTLHPWECVGAAEPDVQCYRPCSHICVEAKAHSPPPSYTIDMKPDAFFTCRHSWPPANTLLPVHTCQRCTRVYLHPPCHPIGIICGGRRRVCFRFEWTQWSRTSGAACGSTRRWEVKMCDFREKVNKEEEGRKLNRKEWKKEV